MDKKQIKRLQKDLANVQARLDSGHYLDKPNLILESLSLQDKIARLTEVWDDDAYYEREERREYRRSR